MAEKRSISAREVIADIRGGMTDEQLMVKYRLTDKGLQFVKDKLLVRGLLTAAELKNESTGTQAAPQSDMKALARKIAEAARAGWSDKEITTAFNFPADKLPTVFATLIEYSYLTQEDYDRRQSRLEASNARKPEGRPATPNADVQVGHTPFAVIRGRTLLASILLAIISTFIVSGILSIVWGVNLESPLANAASMVLGEVFLLLCGAYLLYLAKLSPTVLFGPQPPWSLLRSSMLLAFPLIGLAIAGTYILYLPLSYLIPKFVNWCLFCRPPMIIPMTNLAEGLVNLLSFFAIVLIAPVVEEFFFRGLLLTRWSLKWNVPRGIIASSAVFALLHPDNIIGSFFIGYVMSVLYFQTRSLFVPISLHMAYNGLIWILTGIDVLMGQPYARNNLTEWKSFWWVGMLLAVIVIPWAIWYTRRNYPKTEWRVPCLSREGAV